MYVTKILEENYNIGILADFIYALVVPYIKNTFLIAVLII